MQKSPRGWLHGRTKLARMVQCNNKLLICHIVCFIAHLPIRLCGFPAFSSPAPAVVPGMVFAIRPDEVDAYRFACFFRLWVSIDGIARAPSCLSLISPLSLLSALDRRHRDERDGFDTLNLIFTISRFSRFLRLCTSCCGHTAPIRTHPERFHHESHQYTAHACR